MTHFLSDELVLDSTHHTKMTPYRSQNDPLAPYDNSTEHNRHNGQIKLLLSEVEFLTEVHLTRFYRNGVCHGTTPPLPQFICVYAGGCPGHHIDDILNLFPNVFFVIIDPRFNDRQYKKYQKTWSAKRVAICAKHFDDGTAVAIAEWVSGRKVAHHWVHERLNTLHIKQEEVGYDNLLLISDVRTDAYNADAIDMDMQAQSRWFKQMNASAGLLKFRLPFCTKKWTETLSLHHGLYPYLDGVVFLPIYGPPSTTECRLYVRQGCKEIYYRVKDHESRMAAFETEDRKSHYTDEIQKFSSFDQAAEACVMHKYRFLMMKYGYFRTGRTKYSSVTDIQEAEDDYQLREIEIPKSYL